MTPFIINPHGRLHEWVAEENGYFSQAGLEHYSLASHALITRDAPKVVHSNNQVETNKTGAYQTYEKGRQASVSSACHWTVNMAAAHQHGKLWGECYSLSPSAILVPQDSAISSPQDLANVEIHVGYQSGSHYTTVQALEPFIASDDIKLKFGGSPTDRVDQMLDGLAPAATVFGPQLYLLEQLGFRKILDCTFMMAAMLPSTEQLEDVARYYAALRLAQADIDLMHQRYVHYYLNELPERHAKLVDVKRFGPGERIVFEPYTEAMFAATQHWVQERDFFTDDSRSVSTYAESVVRMAANA